MSQKKARKLPKSTPGSLLELAGALLDALGAPRALRGCSRGLLGTLWQRSGRSRGALGDPPGRPRESPGPLFGAPSAKNIVPEAETAICLKMMTLTALWLCRGGPESSKMRSKCSQNIFGASNMTSEECRRVQRASGERLGGVLGAPGWHFGGPLAKKCTSSLCRS